MASELLALRAERAKPTQSNEDDKAWVKRTMHLHGESSWGFLAREMESRLASIRAEGSAERAKLEGVVGDRDEWIHEILGRYYNDDISVHDAIKEIETGIAPRAARAQPAESGATDRELIAREFEEAGRYFIAQAIRSGAKP